MNRLLSSVVCAILLCLIVIIPIMSWVMLAIGMDVNNVLNAEGYRWIWIHIDSLLAPSYLVPIIAFFIMVGSVKASGIIQVILRNHRTVNEKLGIIAASAVFGLLFMALLVPVFNVHSAMRSVTGQLFPSPWFSCSPYAISAIVFLAMLTFALFAKKDRFYHVIGDLLSEGISCYALWLVDISLANFIFEIIKFIYK